MRQMQQRMRPGLRWRSLAVGGASSSGGASPFFSAPVRCPYGPRRRRFLQIIVLCPGSGAGSHPRLPCSCSGSWFGVLVPCRVKLWLKLAQRQRHNWNSGVTACWMLSVLRPCSWHNPPENHRTKLPTSGALGGRWVGGPARGGQPCFYSALWHSRPVVRWESFPGWLLVVDGWWRKWTRKVDVTR